MMAPANRAIYPCDQRLHGVLPFRRDMESCRADRRRDVRAALKAMIVAKELLESKAGELMKAISHACVRRTFHTYSG
jgi:hypothetical protein